METFRLKLNLSNQQVSKINKENKSKNHGHSKIWISQLKNVNFINNLIKENKIKKLPYVESRSKQQYRGKYETFIHFQIKNIILFFKLIEQEWENDKSMYVKKFNEFKKYTNKYSESSWINEKIYIEPIRNGHWQFNFPMHTKYIFRLAKAYKGYIIIDYNENNNSFYYQVKIDYSLIKKSPFFHLDKQEKNYRIGQSNFRKSIVKIFNNKCIISGLSGDSKIVEAAHIKPYSLFEKNNLNEANNCNNGILLSCNFHKLYDQGIMTFSEEGNLIFSRYLNISDLKIINKSILNQSFNFNNKQQEFLDFHRNNIFLDIIY